MYMFMYTSRSCNAHNRYWIMTEKAYQVDGLSATDLVESYKSDLEYVFDQVLQAPGKDNPAGSRSSRLAHSFSAQPGIMDKAINVTRARNVAGLGRILQSAQEMVRVLFNQKTSEYAYVIGPKLMEEILEKQVLAMQVRIEELQAELEAKSDAARVADARRSFFQLSDSFKPIDADVPIVEGTTPSEAIEF